MSWKNGTNGFAWCRLMSVTAAAVAIPLLFAAAARAQDGVVQNGNYPTSVGLWDVILYEHPDYSGLWVRYALQPGMRQRLVPYVPPELEDRISSIQVGDKVGVRVYQHKNYVSDKWEGTDGFKRSIPSLGTDTEPLNDKISSLIVYPRTAGDVLSIVLRDEHFFTFGKATDFPLPELEASTEESYPFLGDLNLDKDSNQVWVRNCGDWRNRIEVVLYSERDFGGRAITLPGASGVWPDNLGGVDYSDTASSLRVRWKGAPANLGPPAPPPFTVRAGVNLPGRDYKSFEVDGADACWTACAADPACKAYTFVRPGIQRARGVCWLKSSIPTPQNDNDCVSGWIGEAPPPVTTSGPDAVKDFRVVRREGRRILFQIDYRIAPSHGPVVAVGTWLYQAGQSVAGFEPTSITALGDGSVTQWVVLVPGAQASDEVEFVFFQPSQEPFLKTRLPLKQAWKP